MFKILFISIICVFTVQAQLTFPVLSPPSKTSQTVGLTQIEIEYSRPSKRGRIIYGTNGLLPYDELWRTGANTATKITFDDNITIENTQIQKGSYALLTKPGAVQWEINFYPYTTGNWNAYVPQQPIASFHTKPHTLKDPIETLLIYIDNISLDTAQLIIAWGNKKVMLPLMVEVHKKAMANIQKTLSGPTDFDYFQAALYLHEAQKDLDQALSYIQKATQGKNPLFFQVHREALILSDLGRKNEAIQAAKRSLELSREADNKDFVRLNERFIEKWSQ